MGSRMSIRNKGRGREHGKTGGGKPAGLQRYAPNRRSRLVDARKRQCDVDVTHRDGALSYQPALKPCGVGGGGLHPLCRAEEAKGRLKYEAARSVLRKYFWLICPL